MDNSTAREEWAKAWPKEAHTTEYAQKRIKSAKSAKNTPVMIDRENMFGYFQGSHGRYETFLDGCSCVDFARGGKPCKHIYRLAIELGVMEGTAENNPNMIPTPRSEYVSLNETIDKIEALPETTQSKILKIAGGVQPEQRYQYKRDGIEEVLRSGFVIDAAPQEHQIIWGRKDEIAGLLDNAGIPRPPKAKKDELAKICATNIPQKAEEAFDWWITVKMSPEYSRRKIHYYLHRKLDFELLFEPESGEMVKIPLLTTDLPDDDVTEQLIKRGYYKR